MTVRTVLDELKKAQILEGLASGRRRDGRAPEEPRRVDVEPGVIPKANGSARVRLGDTVAICG
ncbi:MAG: exosome complex component Rrp42, partial [Nitrosopumilus sp.]|nr:exosome complex component Rrp42 [Nitrosopumilus sp.]